MPKQTETTEEEAMTELQKQAQELDMGYPKTTKQIFVFGSNLAGRHGAGSAKEAVAKYGAIYGCGEGLQGESYGIPTKDKQLRILPLAVIEQSVDGLFPSPRIILIGRSISWLLGAA